MEADVEAGGGGGDQDGGARYEDSAGGETYDSEVAELGKACHDLLSITTSPQGDHPAERQGFVSAHPSIFARWSHPPARVGPGSTRSSFTYGPTPPCCRARARSKSSRSCRRTWAWAPCCTLWPPSPRPTWERCSMRSGAFRTRSAGAGTS